MDKVLFFKVSVLLWLSFIGAITLQPNKIYFWLEQMGKFYELFEMDAHVGVKELDLQYMKVSMSTIEFQTFFRILSRIISLFFEKTRTLILASHLWSLTPSNYVNKITRFYL